MLGVEVRAGNSSAINPEIYVHVFGVPAYHTLALLGGRTVIYPPSFCSHGEVVCLRISLSASCGHNGQTRRLDDNFTCEMGCFFLYND